MGNDLLEPLIIGSCPSEIAAATQAESSVLTTGDGTSSCDRREITIDIIDMDKCVEADKLHKLARNCHVMGLIVGALSQLTITGVVAMVNVVSKSVELSFSYIAMGFYAMLFSLGGLWIILHIRCIVLDCIAVSRRDQYAMCARDGLTKSKRDKLSPNGGDKLPSDVADYLGDKFLYGCHIAACLVWGISAILFGSIVHAAVCFATGIIVLVAHVRLLPPEKILSDYDDRRVYICQVDLE